MSAPRFLQESNALKGRRAAAERVLKRRVEELKLAAAAEHDRLQASAAGQPSEHTGFAKTDTPLQFVRMEARTKAVVLQAVGLDPAALEYAPAELQNDKSVVLKAVGIDGRALKFASPGLRGDEDVVAEAIRNTPAGAQTKLGRAAGGSDKTGEKDAGETVGVAVAPRVSARERTSAARVATPPPTKKGRADASPPLRVGRSGGKPVKRHAGPPAEVQPRALDTGGASGSQRCGRCGQDGAEAKPTRERDYVKEKAARNDKAKCFDELLAGAATTWPSEGIASTALYASLPGEHRNLFKGVGYFVYSLRRSKRFDVSEDLTDPIVSVKSS